jgi:hypothetical protein
MATPPRKSRAKGRTAEAQFATAQRRIQEARSADAKRLNLSDLSKLNEVPQEAAGLTALQSLNLMRTRVSDLAPLASLTALQSLNLMGTQVSDLAPLAGLTALQSLNLMRTRVSDLAPLASLTALQSLLLDQIQASDLAPLADLVALQRLSITRTRASDITPLAGLASLQFLWLDGTQVNDFTPLAGLTALQGLNLDGTQISDLAPLAGLTALQTLDLMRTQVSDLAPLAGLTALHGLNLDGTQVGDLAPLAGLTALQNLNLDGTRVGDLAPLARLTSLANAAGSRNAHFTIRGLSYGRTPAAKKPPFDQLALLEQPALTVETINEVRRQQGLPGHNPEGYEPPTELPATVDNDPSPVSGLTPPSKPLPTPGPATRFAVTGGRIDIVPPDAWRSQRDQAAVYHARARKLAVDLADRLASTDAVPDVAASVAALTDVLGERLEDVQPDQLRLASRSIAARARTYGHPNAHWEITPDSVSAIFELADLLVDLQSFARTNIEANERAIRELDLTTRQATAAKIALDELSEALETIPEVVTERVQATFTNATLLSDTPANMDVKLAVESERILLTENLSLSIARSLGGTGEGKPPTDNEPSPERPERPRKRPRKRSSSGAALTWDDFKDRLLSRLQKKAPEAIADAALHAAVSTVKHSPKTVAGLGAVIVLWSTTTPIALGGTLALTLAWLGYLLANRKRPKD